MVKRYRSNSGSNLICCDICNTIADVTKAIEGIFGPLPNPLICYHPRTPKVFWAVKNKMAQKIFETAQPIDGAAETLNYLAETFDLVYLTARPKWAGDITRAWLREHGFPLAPIVTTPKKAEWIKENGAALMIEDDPKHIRVIKNLVPVLVPERPWNKDYTPRFKDWNEIKLSLEGLIWTMFC